MSDRRLHGEAGVTLVEVIVSVIILSIIGYALTESVILGLRTAARTQEQVAGSLDRQLVSTYFSADAQSADAVSTGDNACATGSIVTFSWEDGLDKVAAYVVDTDERRLVRRYCEDGAFVVENKLATSLADEAPVTVDCRYPEGDPAAGQPGCAAPNPDTIVLTVKGRDDSQFTLSGARRSET